MPSPTLQEKNPAVGIAPFSKNLTLLRPLDREEKRGPSNVYVNVRCDRRRTADPTFIIPVSVRVWDVNDNAPMWIGAPYRVRLSELTAVGSRVLHNIRATDADQPGPHATIHYSVLPGPNSEYFGFVNELDSILVVKQPLDYETLPNFTLTLRASDNGTPPLYNDTILRVDVLDADDQNPKFSYDHYTATVPDNAEEGTILETSPGPIVAQDQDVGINAPLYYTVSGEKRDLVMVDKDTGRVAVTRRLLEAVDLPVTVVIKATQVDNADRYALATLWIGRKSAALSRPIRFTRRAYVVVAREDSTPGTVLAILHTEPMRPPETSPLQFYVSDRSFLEKFAINSAGEVLLRKPLDYETKDSYSYQVMVTDGITNDTASLNITVQNVNEWEPRFRYPQYEFSVDDDADTTLGLLPVGKLDVHDGDAPDTVTLTLRGAHANLFYINESGEMFLRADALNALNSSVLHVVATAVDSGAPPRQTSVPVLVHVGERLMQARTSTARGGVFLLFACALAVLALLVCALLAYIYRKYVCLMQARTSTARGGVFLLFACALAVLALLVCALLAYIYRNKRRSKTSSTSSPQTTNKSPALSKPHTPQTAVATTNNNNAGGTLASSGSLLSVSAGASTILANSSSRTPSGRQSARFPTKTKIAPAPPTHLHSPNHAHSPSHAHNDVALMSDHLRAHSSGRSGVAWPSHTIPARVKKLSWDDAAQDTQGKSIEQDYTHTHNHLRAHSSGRSGVAWPSHTIPARVKKLSWDDAAQDTQGKSIEQDYTHTQPPARAQQRALGRRVALTHHPREGQEAQLGRRRAGHPGEGRYIHTTIIHHRALSKITHTHNHLRAHSSGRSGVAWPSHTIPARVKKLSWDDAAQDTQGKVGQRRPKHDPRRDQPHRARPHEPHGLLLTTNPHHPFTNPLRPFHPRLTNPNHPAFTPYSQTTVPSHPTVNPNQPEVTPQTTNTFVPYNQLASPKGPNQPTAINHAMIQNLPQSYAPAQAYNSVLIRNYALPNQVTKKDHTKDSKALKNNKKTNPVVFFNHSDSNQPQSSNYINAYHHPQNPHLHFVQISNERNSSHPNDQISKTQPNVSKTNHLLPRILFGTPHPLPNMYQQPPSPLPPTAPRLSQVDPLAAVLSKSGKGKGPPPEYATIDPRKLRLRTLRPVFTRGSKRGNNSASSKTKLTKRKDSRSNDGKTT
ncbi:cadherin domain-containing protein [Phthorimaea operculella]|nr:cadherin domain-containing protein [Phthorimaea operculella]